MSAKPSYFRIGLFIAVALAILAAGLIALGAGQAFRPRVYFETYVDASVQGVDVGSPVKFRGVARLSAWAGEGSDSSLVNARSRRSATCSWMPAASRPPRTSKRRSMSCSGVFAGAERPTQPTATTSTWAR